MRRYPDFMSPVDVRRVSIAPAEESRVDYDDTATSLGTTNPKRRRRRKPHTIPVDAPSIVNPRILLGENRYQRCRRKRHLYATWDNRPLFFSLPVVEEDEEKEDKEDATEPLPRLWERLAIKRRLPTVDRHSRIESRREPEPIPPPPPEEEPLPPAKPSPWSVRVVTDVGYDVPPRRTYTEVVPRPAPTAAIVLEPTGYPPYVPPPKTKRDSSGRSVRFTLPHEVPRATKRAERDQRVYRRTMRRLTSAAASQFRVFRAVYDRNQPVALDPFLGKRETKLYKRHVLRCRQRAEHSRVEEILQREQRDFPSFKKLTQHARSQWIDEVQVKPEHTDRNKLLAELIHGADESRRLSHIYDQVAAEQLVFTDYEPEEFKDVVVVECEDDRLELLAGQLSRVQHVEESYDAPAWRNAAARLVESAPNLFGVLPGEGFVINTKLRKPFCMGLPRPVRRPEITPVPLLSEARVVSLMTSDQATRRLARPLDVVPPRDLKPFNFFRTSGKRRRRWHDWQHKGPAPIEKPTQKHTPLSAGPDVEVMESMEPVNQEILQPKKDAWPEDHVEEWVETSVGPRRLSHRLNMLRDSEAQAARRKARQHLVNELWVEDDFEKRARAFLDANPDYVYKRPQPRPGTRYRHLPFGLLPRTDGHDSPVGSVSSSSIATTFRGQFERKPKKEVDEDHSTSKEFASDDELGPLLQRIRRRKRGMEREQRLADERAARVAKLAKAYSYSSGETPRPVKLAPRRGKAAFAKLMERAGRFPGYIARPATSADLEFMREHHFYLTRDQIIQFDVEDFGYADSTLEAITEMTQDELLDYLHKKEKIILSL